MAQAPYDAPTVGVVDQGLFRLTMSITAGNSGTPAGFGVMWMKESDYIANGRVWPDLGHPLLKYCECYGPYTLNTWDVGSNVGNSPILGAGETSHLQLGDLNDESGLYGNDYDQLTPGTAYVVRAWATEDGGGLQSEYSSTVTTSTEISECTQGFWKTHGPGLCHSGNNANTWPASCFPMTLGTVQYSDAQICGILLQAVNGNGLVSLAHQLITTKLNGCSTSDLTPVAQTIADADALIGGLFIPGSGKCSDFLAPNVTSDLTETLDDYNNGLLGGVADCPTPVHSLSTWGRVKALYR